MLLRDARHDEDVIAAIDETVEGFATGIVDKETTRRFDELTLARFRDLSPEAIYGIREREHVRWAVFAAYLNVNKSLISQWERGEKRPTDPSLTLWSLVTVRGLAAII